MAGNSRKVDVEVSISGEQKYKQAITELNAANKTLGAEMKRLAEEYKGNEQSVEYLAQKGEMLQDILDHQREKVEALKEAVKISAQLHGEASKKTQDLAAQLSNAEASVLSLERAIRDNDKAIEDLNYNTKGYDDAIKALYSDLRVVESEMAAGADTAESLQEKDRILNDILAEQAEKLETLKQKMQEMAQSGTATGDEIRELNQQMNDAKIAYNNTTAAINKNREALEESQQEIVVEEEALTGLGDTLEQVAQKFGITIPDAAKDALNGMESFSAGTVAKMAVAAAAIAAVIKVVKELGDVTLEEAAKVDEYVTQSKITGVPTQMLEAWDYAAPLIDTDAETIKGAMAKLTRAMGDAADGNDAAIEKFQNLGVSITDGVTGQLRSAEEVFYDVIDALGQVENGTERDAAAMELLGKSAQQLNPLIIAGSQALQDYYEEAEEVGYLLSDDQVAALGAVDDAYQRLQLTIEANRKQLAADFAPAAQSAMELFADVVEKAGKTLKDSGLIENLSVIITCLVDIISDVGDLVGSLPGLDSILQGLKITIGAIAQFVALIADAADVVSGVLNPSNWGSGKARTALGWNYDKGEASHWQTTYMAQNGTLDQYMEYYHPTETKPDYDEKTYYEGVITGNIYDRNAAGNDNWRGGLTWVGENGPELVALPQGSQIMNAQESRNLGGDTFYITIDAKSVEEFNDIVDIARNARARRRMR